MRAPGMSGLAGEGLPARSLGGSRIGDHPPARRPDRLVRVVRVVGDLRDRLLRAARVEGAVEDSPGDRVAATERVRKAKRVDLAPAPGLRVRSEAVLQIVERSAQCV